MSFFKKYAKKIVWLIPLILVIAAVALWLSKKTPQAVLKGRFKPGISVVVAAARTGDLPVYLTALGTVIPVQSVVVKSQVSGPLIKVFFKEGQLVKRGDLLAEIDPQPYQAQLLQYQGQLARDKAILMNAKLDWERYQTLWKEGAAARQTLDAQAALVKQAEGTVKMDEAFLKNAVLNVSYTQIRAPIEGRIGLRAVDAGNTLQAGDPNGIGVINTVDPVNVVFTLPEGSLPQVTPFLNTHQPLTVEAYDRNQSQRLAVGFLLTLDNQIDPTTGTIKAKAQFPNPHDQLFPNQFVNLKLLLTTLHQVILIPTAALQWGTAGPFVYVVNPEKKVAVHPVTVKVTEGEETVVEGLAPQQQVVVERADKLTDGAQVTVGA